jgi:hypothetical protein
MSGPIVRTGTNPKFWSNYDRIFGDKTAAAAPTKKGAAKKGAAKGKAKPAPKAAPKAAKKAAKKKAAKKASKKK